MRKHIYFFLIFALFTSISFGQSELWKKNSDKKLNGLEKMERASIPSDYQIMNLDFNAFKQALKGAPIDTEGVFSNTVVYFPNAVGELSRFRIYEAPVMEQGLAEKFPDNKSYVAVGVDNPNVKLRFSVTLFGLHAMSLSGDEGIYYIDTYTKNLNNYIVYSRKNIQSTRSFGCFVQDNHQQVTEEAKNALVNETFASDGKFRQYKLAMACTIEYAAFHINAAGLSAGTLTQKKAAVLAAMNVTMTRVNGIYERDLSLRMNLVANNDLLIFIDSDNFTNNTASSLINESQTVINSTIGAANYNIGHTVSTGGGGLAGLGVVCNDANKARGITGSFSPVGDPYDVDYVAHEMGHQFGANHTFNNSCSGNRNATTAVEPGSGSTIMAYAGICSQNVQNASDPYFHAVSLAEIETIIAGTGNCSANTSNNNSAPIIGSISNYVIPISTAFELTASVNDIDGDNLTYCWEQTNNGISTQPPTAGDAVNGPRFRSINPTSNSNRYFPMMSTILSGLTANTWEVIPSTAKEMTFALTVRDNKLVLGGQTKRANMTVTTVAAAGPFVITAPNTNVSWQAGSNQDVTWNVAGTTANGVNTPFVDIYLSTNGGSSFPILLASQVPNDGTERITVPNIVGTQNRIMVKGYNNIFLDVSNTNFTITSAATSTMAIAFEGIAGQQNKTICQGSNARFNISYQTLGGFSANTTFAVTGNPTGTTVTFSPTTINSNGTVVMEISNTAAVTSNLYTLTVTATSGAITKRVNFYLNVLSSNFSSISLLSPTNGATVFPNSVSFSWTNIGASAYDVEIATTNNFTNIIASGETSSNSINFSNLPSSSNLFWRVRPKNQSCQGSFSSAFSFSTNFCGTISSTNVPIAIPAVVATVESTIQIPANQSVTISDINAILNISHTWINDLKITLISPNNTQVVLVDRPCTNIAISNIISTFDDAGATIVCGLNPGISGVVKPSQVLSAFNGQTSGGTWTLRVQDFVRDDGGAINNWSLGICSSQAPLNEIDNQIKDFSLYPNPNNGNFTIQFNSNSGNIIKIHIHDIRGREIFNKSYNNNGLFNEVLQLDNVQSGLYLVTVQDGPKKVVKKIVVQ